MKNNFMKALYVLPLLFLAAGCSNEQPDQTLKNEITTKSARISFQDLSKNPILGVAIDANVTDYLYDKLQLLTLEQRKNISYNAFNSMTIDALHSQIDFGGINTAIFIPPAGYNTISDNNFIAFNSVITSLMDENLSPFDFEVKLNERYNYFLSLNNDNGYKAAITALHYTSISSYNYWSSHANMDKWTSLMDIQSNPSPSIMAKAAMRGGPCGVSYALSAGYLSYGNGVPWMSANFIQRYSWFGSLRDMY